MAIQKPITTWDELPDIMDLSLASRFLPYSYGYLKQLCQQGKFPAYKLGKFWMVDKPDLREYIKQQKEKALYPRQQSKAKG